jgi:large subunit ribosomal protein L22
MISRSKVKYLRISSTKVRLVIDLIRGKDIVSARNLLLNANKGATEPVRKALHSAVSNAKQKGLAEDQLFISKIFSDQGPMWKRWRSAPFGRALRILKKTSHLTVELDLITK